MAGGESMAVIGALLLIQLLVWLLVEGRTILLAASAALPGGPRRLTALGATFLGTEAWTLALLGSGHALIPGAVHAVLGPFGGALALFVAGWMLRDLGLWSGPRSISAVSERLWRLAVTLGAVGQLLGVLGVAAGWLVLRPPLAPGAGAGLLVLVLPPVLLLGAVLLVVLHRLPPAAHFRWGRRGSGPAER